MRRSNFDLETLIERMMGEIVENTDEPSFGEGQDRFQCQKCGHAGHADVIAAINQKARMKDQEITLYTPKERVRMILVRRYEARLGTPECLEREEQDGDRSGVDSRTRKAPEIKSRVNQRTKRPAANQQNRRRYSVGIFFHILWNGQRITSLILCPLGSLHEKTAMPFLARASFRNRRRTCRFQSRSAAGSKRKDW